MRRKWNCYIGLCLFAFWWTAGCGVLVAQGTNAAGGNARAPEKPGLLDESVQTFFELLGNPTLKITADNTNPSSGQSISVQAVWSKGVTNASYRFNWGDGSTQTDQSPASQQSHSYVKTGKFTVWVQGTATFNGKSVTSSSRVPITVKPAPEVATPKGIVPQPVGPPAGTPVTPPVVAPTDTPVAKAAQPTVITLRAIPDSVVQGRAIEFSVSVDPPAGLDRFHYYFGDKSDTAGHNGTAHTYDLPGIYSAYVTAESNSSAGLLYSASIPVSIRSAASRPSLILKRVTANPLAGKQVSVSAALSPEQSPVSYVFNWGDGSPAQTVDSLGEGHHTFAAAGQYRVAVRADTVRDGRLLAVTAEPLPLIVAAPPNRTFPALILAGIVILASGLSYTVFKPKVSAVYRSMDWDLPRFPGKKPIHLAVTFRSSERPAQHSIRILK